MTLPYEAAALQFPVDMGNVEVNAARAFRLLREAAGAGASLAVLPEMWSTGFCYDRLLALCDATPDLLREIGRFAAERRMVVAGSLPERSGKDVFNTLVVVNANGRVAGRYRKTHLFSPSGEHLHFRRGTEAGSVRTAVGALGPLVCYDLRFPELSRKYFLEGSALLCVSAQWPSARKEHWAILAAARAVENQAFVVAANAVGRSGDFHFAGDSVILSPTGERLAAAGGEEGLAVASIDPSKAEDFRRRIPCAADRNERAYRKNRRGR